jgi:hypothetical protein
MNTPLNKILSAAVAIVAQAIFCLLYISSLHFQKEKISATKIPGIRALFEQIYEILPQSGLLCHHLHAVIFLTILIVSPSKWLIVIQTNFQVAKPWKVAVICEMPFGRHKLPVERLTNRKPPEREIALYLKKKKI